MLVLPLFFWAVQFLFFSKFKQDNISSSENLREKAGRWSRWKDVDGSKLAQNEKIFFNPVAKTALRG